MNVKLKIKRKKVYVATLFTFNIVIFAPISFYFLSSIIRSSRWIILLWVWWNGHSRCGWGFTREGKASNTKTRPRHWQWDDNVTTFHFPVTSHSRSLRCYIMKSVPPHYEENGKWLIVANAKQKSFTIMSLSKEDDMKSPRCAHYFMFLCL